jgi:hypothetical protein
MKLAQKAIAWPLVVLLVLFPVSWRVGQWHRVDKVTAEPVNSALNSQLSRLQYGYIPGIQFIFSLYKSQPASGGAIGVSTAPGEYSTISVHYEPVYWIYFFQLGLASFLVYKLIRHAPNQAQIDEQRRAETEPSVPKILVTTSILCALYDLLLVFFIVMPKNSHLSDILLHLVIIGFFVSWVSISIGTIVALTGPLTRSLWIYVAVYILSFAVNMSLTLVISHFHVIG